MADAIHVTHSSINKYENHNIEPEIAILIRIADFFNTSVDYLIGHTDERRRIERTEVYQLNADEAAIITRYRCLHENEKNCIRLTMDAFIGSN